MQTSQDDVRIALPDETAELLKLIRARAAFKHENFCAARLQSVNFRPRIGRASVNGLAINPQAFI